METKSRATPHAFEHRPHAGGEGKAVSYASGWLTSLVIHGVLILGAAVFYIERNALEDDSVYLTQIRHADQQKIAELEKPKDDRKADGAGGEAAEAPDVPSFSSDDPTDGGEGGPDSTD